MESKMIQVREAENRIIVVRGWWEGEMGRCWSKGIKFQLYKINISSKVQRCEHEQFCIVYLKLAERIDLKHPHHTQKR